MECLLGQVEVHLSLEDAKDKWAAMQLLRRTGQVTKHAVDENHNVEMILGMDMDMVRYTYVLLIIVCLTWTK